MYQLDRPLLDFDTAKIQYELLGDSFAKISATQNIAVDSLERVAAAENWTRLRPSAKAYQTYLAGILNSHRAKISLAMLYRELEMFPHVAELETLLIGKLLQTAHNIDPFNDKAPQQLKSLTSALNSITERQEVIKKQLADLFTASSPQGVQTSIEMDITNDQSA
jgi:hypothetical protein